MSTDKVTTTTSVPIPEEYLAPPIDFWTLGRLVSAILLTAGLLPLGLGYTLVFYVLEGRPTRMAYALLIPAAIAVLFLTWRLGSKPALAGWGKWVAGVVTVLWMIATFIIGLLMTAAPKDHYWIILLYGVATLWLPWLVWIGYSPESIFSKLSVLVVLGALIFGFHYIVEVPGLAGSSTVYVNWREGEAQRLLASAAKDGPTATIDLTPTPYDFGQYLGPERTAVVSGLELQSDWTKHPPKRMWRQPIGKGWSAFAIVGDYAFTQEQRGKQECVVCYELRTGKAIWVHSDDASFESKFGGDGPRATPTVLEGRVYTVGATGIVNCLDGTTGKKIWSTNILETPEGNLYHGVCSSPLVVGNNVYVCPVTKEDESLAALDKETGKILFTAGAGRASYSSPVWCELAGIPQVLSYNAKSIVAYDPKSGAVLWSFNWGNNDGINASQPLIYRDDSENVFLSTAYGIGSTLLAVKQTPEKRWEVQQRWKTIKMRNKFSTSIVMGDFAVGIDDGILAAVDLASGKQLWKKGRYGHGQILQIGKRVVVLTENGDLVLLEVDKKGINELGTLAEVIRGKTWNHLAFSPPYLLVRNADEAACYRLAIEGQEEGTSAEPAAPPETKPAPTDTPVNAEKAKKPDPFVNTAPEIAAPPRKSEPTKVEEKKPDEPKPAEDPLALPDFDSLLPNDKPKAPTTTDPLPEIPPPPPLNP